MGGIRPSPDDVLLDIFKRAEITKKEYEHIELLIRNMHKVPRPPWATNPHVIALAAFYARMDIEKYENGKRKKRAS